MTRSCAWSAAFTPLRLSHDPPAARRKEMSTLKRRKRHAPSRKSLRLCSLRQPEHYRFCSTEDSR